MDLQRRELRFKELGASDTFDVPNDWRFMGIFVVGSGVVTLTNGRGETLSLNDTIPFNMYLPSEHIKSITITTDASATAKISYLK